MERTYEQHHVVGSMRMDFRLTDPSLGREVQETLSQLARKKLMPAMEAVFSEVCSPDVTHRLERLVVDLGVVPLAHLEEEILARFTPRLKQALEDALRSSPERGASVDARAAGIEEPSSLALFEHLLQHGALPWWAGAQSGASLEDLFMELVVTERTRMEQVIRRLGAWQQVRLRLIRQFSPKALSALVELLEPADAVMILQCAEHLGQLHEKSPVVTVGARDFHEAKWDLMLHTLLKEQGTRFNTKAFLRSNVVGLAQRFGIGYTDLIHHLAEPVAEPRVSGRLSLIEALLRELSVEAGAEGDEPAEMEDDGDDAALLWGRFMRHFEAGGPNANTRHLRAIDEGLVRAWGLQSSTWQRSLWEAILFRCRPEDVAQQLLAVFPPELWTDVQKTFPQPLDPELIQTVEAALGTLRQGSTDGGWRAEWWHQVLSLALKPRGNGRVLSDLLQAGMPQGMPVAEAGRRLLLLPAMHSRPLLRRAVEQLTDDAEKPAKIPAWRQDADDLLGLFDAWLQGADSSRLNALPGGAESWFVRLELHQPAALVALLRKRSASGMWQRLATRAQPGLRRRILFRLAPRSAPLLWAVLEAISQHRAALFGSTISSRRLEARCWAVMVTAILSSSSEPAVHATMQAVRSCLDEMARSSGVTALQLDQRFRALTLTLPTASAVALARLGSESELSSLRRNVAALLGTHGWLEAWRALSGAGRGMDAFDVLWAVGERATPPHEYQRQLLNALTERRVMEAILRACGEDFFLWVATQRSVPWRAELSAWLDLLEKTGTEAGLLRCGPMEWRWRALEEILRWQQQGSVRLTSPRSFVLQLLRRLGASEQALASWKSQVPASPLPAAKPTPTRRASVFSVALVDRLKLWKSLLNTTAPSRLSKDSRAALWAAAGRDERYLYRELLDALPGWQGVQRVLAAGGEAFFLGVAVAESSRWRTEFASWLAFIEKVATVCKLLPFDKREWRARALSELLLLDRQTTAHAHNPGMVMLEVLRRLGVPSYALSHWGEIAAAFRDQAPTLARLRQLPEFHFLAELLHACSLHGAVKAPARIAEFMRRVPEQSAEPARRAPRNRQPARAPERKLTARTSSPQSMMPGDSYYVENAGLVILSPFFGMLHEKHGLLEEGRFRDHAAAERGVHLLQALLTEETAVPEQALVLNKVLCGLTPDIPVVRENGLVEQDRTHTQMLLRSAIQNWPVLNNVSIDGFRGSFLWRRGKLTRGEDRWTLTIEHRGFDVLMSSIPWSFAVIKPLWMPDPLYVDWV